MTEEQSETTKKIIRINPSNRRKGLLWFILLFALAFVLGVSRYMLCSRQSSMMPRPQPAQKLAPVPVPAPELAPEPAPELAPAGAIGDIVPPALRASPKLPAHRRLSRPNAHGEPYSDKLLLNAPNPERGERAVLLEQRDHEAKYERPASDNRHLKALDELLLRQPSGAKTSAPPKGAKRTRPPD